MLQVPHLFSATFADGLKNRNLRDPEHAERVGVAGQPGDRLVGLDLVERRGLGGLFVGGVDLDLGQRLQLFHHGHAEFRHHPPSGGGVVASGSGSPAGDVMAPMTSAWSGRTNSSSRYQPEIWLWLALWAASASAS